MNLAINNSVQRTALINNRVLYVRCKKIIRNPRKRDVVVISSLLAFSSHIQDKNRCFILDDDEDNTNNMNNNLRVRKEYTYVVTLHYILRIIFVHK